MPYAFIGLLLLAIGLDQHRGNGLLGILGGFAVIIGFIYAFFVADWWAVLITFILSAALSGVAVVLLRKVLSAGALSLILIPLGAAIFWFGLLNPSDGVLI